MAVVAVLAAPSALAVHDLDFQLDGDIDDSTTTTVGGDTQTVDWETLFDSAGVPKTLPAGFESSGFDVDFLKKASGSFSTADPSTFATGSKDTLPITPGWQCNQDNNVNSKTDVMNAYAASFTAANGHEILYFALERNANTGTGNVGFWFLQDDADCESAGGTTAFTGDHTDGDILIVSEFTQGGSVSTINAYVWEGGVNGTLNPASVAQGANCIGTAGGDDICAQVNAATISGIPWETANKQDGVGHSLRTSEFFEGGIDLTQNDLGGKCFNVFIGDTRSSTSLTATIFDFSRGLLGGCTSETVTTPQTGAGGSIPAAGLSIGTGSVVVRDHAVVTVDGVDEFDGTVTFSLCGPFALNNTTTNCATGGAQIGSPVAVDETNAANVNSANTTLTSVGNYCWRAVFSGDSTTGVPGSSDPEPTDTTNRSECFKVNPVTPTLTTTAGADVLLGASITDTASLTGTANQPGTGGLGGAETISPGSINPTTAGAPAGGTITFTVKGPDNCNASGLTVTGSPVTVSGDNTSYGPVSATPTAVGKYTFVAQYSGSSPNTLGAGPSSCPPAAGDGDEEVLVTGAASLATAQRWLPNDTAHITSPATTTLAGNVTFTLYNDGTCGQNSGVSQYTVTKSVTADNNAGDTANDRHVSTANTAFFVTVANDATAYSWKVHYDDTALADPADVCETTSAFTLVDEPPPAP